MEFVEIEYRRREKKCNMAAMQSHSYYEIYYLTSGTRNLFVGDRLFVIDEGSVVILPPSTMHKTEGGSYERINIYISPELLDERERGFLNGFSASPAFKPSGKSAEQLKELISAYLSLIGGSDSSLGEKYRLHFAKLALLILQASVRSPIASSELSALSGGEGDIILSVLAYINSNLSEEITLADLCKRFFLSRNTLCRRFRATVGASVMEYCTGARLSMAKRLLLEGNSDMEEIAERCGFSSANYFSLIFKKKIGISPMNYRKKK